MEGGGVYITQAQYEITMLSNTEHLFDVSNVVYACDCVYTTNRKRESNTRNKNKGDQIHSGKYTLFKQMAKEKVLVGIVYDVPSTSYGTETVRKRDATTSVWLW